MRKYLILLFVLVFLVEVSSKLFQGTVNVATFRKAGGWHYLGRMTLRPGRTTLDLNIEIYFPEPRDVPSYIIEVVAVPNHLWQAELQQKCHFANHSPEVLAQKSKEQFSFPVTLSQKYGYKSVISANRNINHQRTYNLVLRDCSKSLLKQSYNRRSKILVQVDIKNNESQSDAHEDCYSWAFPLLALTQLVLIFVIMKKEQEEEGSHYPKLLIRISLWVGLSSLMVKYTSHVIMTYLNGRTYEVFEVFYLLLHSISDYLIIYLLIFLAFGWTLKFTNNYDQELYIPLSSMLGFIHIILVILNKVSDTHDKYHMFDTVPAYVMLIFRILAFILFGYAIMRSLLQLKQEESKLRQYYYHLTWLGSLYLGFVPACFMLIQFVQQQKRQEIMVLAIQVIRISLNAWLVYLVSSKVSSYRQVVDASFMEKPQKHF